MAIIKKKQLKELSGTDLAKRLAELRLDVAKDRAQIAVGGSPPNPGKLREKRRTIARILTRLNIRREAETKAKPAVEKSKKPQASAAENIKTGKASWAPIRDNKKKEVGKTA